MKILLIGEYSGFSLNLKQGFIKLGHECTIVHEGDSWKKFKSDKNSYCFNYKNNFRISHFEIKYSWIFNSILQSIKFSFLKKKFKKKFDCILIINYEFIKLDYEFYLPQFSITDLKNIIKANGKIYLSACGDDNTYISYLNKVNDPLAKYHLQSKFFKSRFKKIENKLYPLIEGVIPVMYDYSVAYNSLFKGKINIFDTIPLPFKNQCDFQIEKINNKITIMYGKNRPSKGYIYIHEAVKKIELTYPEKVTIIKTDKLPYDSYLKKIEQTDILIDQCYSHSYGMNAILGMSMGKVVLSGNSQENINEFNTNTIPIVNIVPDAEYIFNVLENLISNPDKIIKIKYESKTFADTFHDSNKIAQEYIKLFSL